MQRHSTQVSRQDPRVEDLLAKLLLPLGRSTEDLLIDLRDRDPDFRAAIDAIEHRHLTGVQWRQLPPERRVEVFKIHSYCVTDDARRLRATVVEALAARAGLLRQPPADGGETAETAETDVLRAAEESGEEAKDEGAENAGEEAPEGADSADSDVEEDRDRLTA